MTKAESQMLLLRQQRFEAEEGHGGLKKFVPFSAYRFSSTRFVALGLSLLSLHSSLHANACSWRSAKGEEVVEGKVVIKFPGEHHAKQYETILLFCDLAKPTSARVGGTLSMTIDGEQMVVYIESKGSKEPPDENIPEDEQWFQHNITYCSAPMYGAIDPKRMIEWMNFHITVHGIDYLHIYDAGAVDEAVAAVLTKFVKRNLVEVTDIRAPAQYDTWSYTQVLMVNDCAFRTRHTTRWALMIDVDEYLYISTPPHSLSALVSTMPSLAWLSFGSLTFPLELCGRVREEGWQPWAVEQLVFREPLIHCKEPARYYSREICLKWDGHRKYVVNPRKINVLQIHRVYEAPQEGLNVHTSVARLNHYRGLGIRNIDMCRQVISLSLPPPKGFLRDLSMARIAVAARAKLK